MNTTKATVLVMLKTGKPKASVHVDECTAVRNASYRVMVLRGAEMAAMVGDLRARDHSVTSCRCVVSANHESMRMGG